MTDTCYCTFCGKSQHEVETIIAGTDVSICDECVDLCKEITEEQKTMSKKNIEGMSEGMYRTFLAEKEKQRTGAYIKSLERDLDNRITDRQKTQEYWLRHVKKNEMLSLVQTVAILSFLAVLAIYLKDLT